MVKIIMLIVACYIVVFICYKHLKAKRNISDDSPSNLIVKITQTNNSYQPMLDVLASLDKDLNELGVQLNVNMRGYLEYGKTQ